MRYPPGHASAPSHSPADWQVSNGVKSGRFDANAWVEEKPHLRDYWHGTYQGRVTSAGLTTAQYNSLPTGKWQWRNVTNQVFSAGEKCFNCIGTWTLQHWRERLFAKLAEVRELGYPDEFIRMWDFYFCYCEGGFMERAIGDVQLLLAKPESQPLFEPRS